MGVTHRENTYLVSTGFLLQSPVLKKIKANGAHLSKPNSNNLGTNTEHGIVEKDQAVDSVLSLAHTGHILIL